MWREQNTLLQKRRSLPGTNLDSWLEQHVTNIFPIRIILKTFTWFNENKSWTWLIYACVGIIEPFRKRTQLTVPNPQPKNPLHGITLEMILTHLVQHYGWSELSVLIPIRFFYNDPSIKSSLQFLRRTSWARKKVEDLYLDLIAK